MAVPWFVLTNAKRLVARHAHLVPENVKTAAYTVNARKRAVIFASHAWSLVCGDVNITSVQSDVTRYVTDRGATSLVRKFWNAVMFVVV